MTRRREAVVIRRPVSAELVPSGQRIDLEPGTLADVTQALGSSFTLYVEGHLVRLAGVDADAIGKEVPQAPELPAAAGPDEIRALVWQTLKTCYDPEIPVNIVDLGLVYLCELSDAEGGGKKVNVKMTLTAPGCGMGPVLAGDVRSKIMALPGVKDAEVEVVFDPVWDRSMMSEAARLQLGMMW